LPDSVPPEEVSAAHAPGADGRRFDVFLSHNSRDKPFVERIAERLKRSQLSPWLDAWQLVPGLEDLQSAKERALAVSRELEADLSPKPEHVDLPF
jgi:hypothetical protein